MKEDDSDKERSSVGLLAVGLILVLIALVLLLDMDYNILPFLDIGWSEPLHTGLLAGVVIITVWIWLWVLGHFFEKTASRRMASHAQARSIWKLISYSVWAVIIVILTLGIFGGVASTALGIGLVGAALAFVLQKPLLNIAGWVFITYHRMFKIGDRVSMGGVKGYVLDIRVMHTELQEIGEWLKGEDFTGRVVLVPNGVVFDGPLYNYTRDAPYIWDEVVNLVTYESDIEVAKEHMLESAKEVVAQTMSRYYERYRRRLAIHDLDEFLLREPKLRMQLADSGVNVSVLYWCPAEFRRTIKSQIVERVWKRFMEDPKVGIAYPHMEIVKHETYAD